MCIKPFFYKFSFKMSPAIISGFFIQADINEIFDCGTQIFVFVVDDFEFALQTNVADSNSFHVALFERP